MILLKRSVALLLSISLMLATAPQSFAYQTDQSSPPAPQAAQQSPEQLQQLVAPIALYPDALVAQILAASTYPAEVVEADRWMQQHSSLKGKKLADDVNKQSWDPSVKALAQFPSVLANMDKNLSWTSSLGEAYMNQSQDVMNAVQVMRARAESAGDLKSTPQEKVTTQGQTVVIEPVNPDVVYVPQYDPWLVYGAPLAVWPGWYMYPGLYLAGAGIAFGVGFGVGFFAGFGWGWGHWGFDWHNRAVLFNHGRYFSHSREFANRNNFNHGNFNHGNFNHGSHGVNRAGGFHGGAPSRGSTGAQHGFAAAHNQPGMRSGASSGVNHGGVTMASSSRGASSFGGGSHEGGGFHGGGGSHGGGGRR
jgi:Protein of unknown function (DUF3300)